MYASSEHPLGGWLSLSPSCGGPHAIEWLAVHGASIPTSQIHIDHAASEILLASIVQALAVS